MRDFREAWARLTEAQHAVLKWLHDRNGKPKETTVNKITDAEAERLAMLAEEAAEVVQIVGKILRHGYASYHPARPEIPNRELLDDELCDLLAIAKRMVGEGDIEGDFLLADHNAVWKHKLRFTHHQEVALTRGDDRG